MKVLSGLYNENSSIKSMLNIAQFLTVQSIPNKVACSYTNLIASREKIPIKCNILTET